MLTFKDIKGFQSFLRRGLAKGGNTDVIKIGAKVFTLHEYDGDGRHMSWGNKRHDQLIGCDTWNRYQSWGDAKVFRFVRYGALREDIGYAE